mmetsp:Transcript_107349/g.256416  ORF Transcript_107349/g.256416 Transcript_107349/m.256416 type:complete len:208 (-) Transcript_107349:400-1023(-)
MGTRGGSSQALPAASCAAASGRIDLGSSGCCGRRCLLLAAACRGEGVVHRRCRGNRAGHWHDVPGRCHTGPTGTEASPSLPQEAAAEVAGTRFPGRLRASKRLRELGLAHASYDPRAQGEHCTAASACLPHRSGGTCPRHRRSQAATVARRRPLLGEAQALPQEEALAMAGGGDRPRQPSARRLGRCVREQLRDHHARHGLRPSYPL